MKHSRAVLLALVLLIAISKWRRAPGPTVAHRGAVAPADGPDAPAARAPTAAAPTEGPPPAPAPAPAPVAAIPVPRADDFARFDELAAKVFMTDDEAAARARLAHDPALLTEAGRLLVRREMSPGLLEHQNQALALLLESAAAGDAAAKRALTGVIGDAGVEDARLPRPVRENLAGLKAEAMYRWSAGDPGAVAAIEGAIPGDVSRRLWTNATARQRQNATEGAALGPGGRVAAIPTSDDAQ